MKELSTKTARLERKEELLRRRGVRTKRITKGLAAGYDRTGGKLQGMPLPEAAGLESLPAYLVLPYLWHP